MIICVVQSIAGVTIAKWANATPVFAVAMVPKAPEAFIRTGRKKPKKSDDG